MLHVFLAQAAANGAAPAAFGGIILVVIILAILASIFWLWMLVDAIMNEPSGVEKIIWVLVILFLHLLGALIYFFARRSGRSARVT
ncbi:MAG TPA: PLD nuclease N-terminal domain-containing protein [Phycisphaerae bacterium]|jgi:hypothetical protein